MSRSRPLRDLAGYLVTSMAPLLVRASAWVIVLYGFIPLLVAVVIVYATGGASTKAAVAPLLNVLITVGLFVLGNYGLNKSRVRSAFFYYERLKPQGYLAATHRPSNWDTAGTALVAAFFAIGIWV
ncbi:hypothetical protein [Asanoa ishikariensis]|nr:hypothetical protein [Asanoa ishikariensis]